ncbi:hypothetical protein EON65_23550 [archaeon]|nr:MAG: hypothetical protein EON65_23550 [archaeon]
MRVRSFHSFVRRTTQLTTFGASLQSAVQIIGTGPHLGTLLVCFCQHKPIFCIFVSERESAR